ncbi:sulfotransferase [Novosphingobium sp. M1R2S20]|uniref:Sulfotransferase n=1 Tax=Novosphingobium rhizovicinum TaxID=3228928 RepID=A0ABV3RE90_9SPHN
MPPTVQPAVPVPGGLSPPRHHASSDDRRLGRISTALERAWQRGWLSRPVLEPDAMISVARKRTGLNVFGDEAGWRERLDCLVHALHGEARLSPLGTVIAYGQLVSALADRARMHALWERHPEILSQPFAAPIIVLGQMRSGSTRMQRLLACDPRLTHMRFFESWNPLPLKPRMRRVDDRLLRAWVGLRMARWLNPQFDTLHPTGTTQADEEIGLHNISIFGSAFEAQWRIPSFAAACEAMDTRPIYAEFRRLLQTVAWLRRERTHRPWVLKLPQLTQDLDAVLATFPDARLVCLDRPASALVASSSSLVRNQMQLQSNSVDPGWIGREWLRKVALRQRRTAQARARSEVPQVDIAFDEIGADWRAAMTRVYRALDMPLLPDVERRMARYLADTDQRKLAQHRYTLEEFGLSHRDVELVDRPRVAPHGATVLP